MRPALPRLFVLIMPALLLAGCGSNPDAPKSDGEAAATAKAVADVDGAMADAGMAKTAPATAK